MSGQVTERDTIISIARAENEKVVAELEEAKQKLVEVKSAMEDKKDTEMVE